MDAAHYFEGKKVTVMGLGLLGRGLGDVKYLASCGAELIVTDLKTPEALATSIEELKEFPQIQFVLGEHRLEDFHGRDFILKAAGVPLDSPYIAEARKEGTPIKMSASLFMEIAHMPVIGVTGTRGKSTVTHMIHSILLEAGKKVLLGGNVRGVSTLALLPEATPEHIALFELDSWQLQGFGDAGISPQLAVFTTFFPDHLNYYHDNLDAYLADKANIFINQKSEDIFVLGSQCAEMVKEKYGAEIHGKLIEAGEGDLPNDWKLKIPGAHNRYDAALALATARAYGIPDEASRRALENFTGVPGRLELIRTVNGIEIYNDTNATTPDATLAALQALSENHAGRIVLIMGGADKTLDMSALLAAIPQSTKYAVFLAGTGTNRIRDVLPSVPIFDNFESAVRDAFAHAEAGDALVLSPAFASFGMFKNEYDRGDQFNSLVTEIGEKL